MKRIILIISILIIVIGGFVAIRYYANNTEEGLLTIKVSEVTRSIFYAPQYVAILEGYFEKEGLDIELTTGSGADTVMTSVLSGQTDIGFAGPEASIYVYNEGKEDYTEVFAQLTKKDGSFLVAKENTNNFSFEDLKGKTIIPGRKGGVPYMTLEYILKNNGIDTQVDVNLDDSIKFDLMAGAFASGNADYVTLFEPTASMTEMQNQGYIVMSVGEEAGEIPYTAYFASKSYIDENKETIQKFTNAIYEGQKWVELHSAKEIAEKIQGFFPATELEIIENAVQSYIEIDAWSSTPVLNEEGFNRLQDIMINAGELNEKVPFNQIVNNEFAEEAIK